MNFLSLVFTLGVFACVSGIHVTHFLHGTSGQEVVYNYVAKVKTVESETDSGSAYIFKADLHMRIDSNGNGSIAYFVNPIFQMYTGKLKGFTFENTKPEYIPVPKEAEHITLPFYITYDHFGLVREVFTQEGDVQWSINLKKGVASALQIDFEELYKHPTTQKFSFHTVESTTLGNLNVSYSVVPTQDSYQVVKTADVIEKAPVYEYSNIEVTVDPVDVLRNYHPHIVYDIVKTPTGHLVKKIEYIELKYMLPFFKQSTLINVACNQTLTYKETITPEIVIDIPTLKVYNPILYTHDDQFYTDYLMPKVDMVIVGPKVHSLLERAYEYLQINPISTNPPNTEYGLTVSKIVEILRPLQVENYRYLHILLTKTVTPKDLIILNLFYKILPTVGTKNSVIFTRDLIVGHKVKGNIASTMLYSLSSNVRKPSIEILRELEVFTTMEDQVKPDVSSAGILTFGTLIYRTFKSAPENKLLEKYIKVYYKKLKESKTYQEQLTWLYGMKNIRIGSVYQLVTPIVRGEQVLDLPYDRNLRLHSVYVVAQGLMTDHKLLYETLYPIFIDTTLPNELRIPALRAILMTEEISYCNNIFWVMQKEQNPHIHAYFYSFFRSIAESDSKRQMPVYEYAHHMIRYRRHFSTVVDTSYFLYDYVDPETKFGGSVSGHFIANEKYNRINQIYVQFSPYIMDKNINLYGLYVKYEGIENPLAKFWPKLFTFKPDIVKDKPVKSFEKVPVHVEVTLMANGKIVYTKTYNDETIKSFYAHSYLTLLSTVKYYLTHVFNVVEYELYVPTALGIPIKLYTHIPLVAYLKHDVITGPTTDPAEVNLKMASYLRLWSHGTYGMSVYNPFGHSWHGIERVHALDVNIPANFEVTLNFVQNTVKLSLSRGVTDTYNYFGLKTHVKTEAFLKEIGEVDYLKKTCGTCENYVRSTHGEKYRTNSILHETHSKNLGLHYYVGLYDVEVTPNTKIFKSLSDLLINYHFTYDETVPFSRYFMTLYSWCVKALMPPKPISYGFVAMIHPCKIYPVEKVDIVFRTNLEELEHKFWTVPSYKILMRLGVAFKGPKDVLINNWDVNVVTHHQNGQYFKDLSISAVRTSPDEKNLNICLEWDKTIGEDNVHGKMNFYHGYSNEYHFVKDNFTLSVNWTGSQSDDQKKYTYDPYYTYSECSSSRFIDSDYTPVNLDCANAYTSLRKYVYNVEYQNVPLYFYHFFDLLWDTFRVSVPHHTTYEPLRYIQSNKLVVDITYPVYHPVPYSPYSHVVVTFPYKTHIFEHVPYYNWMWFLQPETPYLTRYFKHMKTLGMVHSCAVFPLESVPVEYNMMHHAVKTTVPTEWTLYASDKPTDYTWAVYVKKHPVGSYVSIKLVLNGHEIYVSPLPNGPLGKFEFKMSDELLQYMQTGHYAEDNYSFKIYNINNAVLLTMPHVSLYVVYDGHHVVIEVPKDYHVTYHGQCFV